MSTPTPYIESSSNSYILSVDTTEFDVKISTKTTIPIPDPLNPVILPPIIEKMISIQCQMPIHLVSIYVKSTDDLQDLISDLLVIKTQIDALPK